jgi:CheY-like chemotaxis protein
MPGEAQKDNREEWAQMQRAMLHAVGDRLRGRLESDIDAPLPPSLAHFIDELADADAAEDLVLLVTRDPAEWQDVRLLLRECGLRPVFRTDGDTAIRWLDRCAERARLLLIDIQIGGNYDGIEFAHFVAQRWPQIRLLVVTAFPDRWLGTPEGVAFLRKPILPLEVVRQAQDVKRSDPGSSPTERISRTEVGSASQRRSADGPR